MNAAPLWRWNRLLAAAAAVGLATLLTGCGTDPNAGNDLTAADPPATDAAGGEGAGDDRADGATGITVVSPAAGDTVSVPFDVTVETGVELGTIDDELHHLHIWFDEGDFGLFESASATIDGTEVPVPEGETTMFVQVHTHEHGSVGDPVPVPLTVEGGDSGDDGGNEDPGYTY